MNLAAASTMPRATYSPGSEAWARYGRLLLDLPGALAVTNRSNEPDIVRVTLSTPEFALLAGNAIRDVVDGARIIMQTPDGTQPPVTGGWWDEPANVVRAMSGIYGVVGSRRDATYAVLHAVNETYRGLLEALVEPKVGDYRVYVSVPFAPRA